MSNVKTIEGVTYADLAELRSRIEHLMYLRKQKALITAAIDVVEGEIQAAILAQEADGATLDGVPVFTYKQDGTFPYAKYANENPHIAAQCMETKEVFSVDRLKRLFPQEYMKWRPRSFKAVNRKG